MQNKGSELNGKTILITGASSGLGRHFALVLSDAGAQLALTGRRVGRLGELCAEITAKGGRALPLALDVRDTTSIREAFESCERQLGPVDVLINNAGINGAGRAIDITPQAYDEIFETNLRGAFFMATEAARRMMARRAAGSQNIGRIINIASVAVHTLLPNLSLYNMTKAGMAMMTRALAREWGRQGINVNAICPGYVETEMNDAWFQGEAGKAQIASFLRRRLIQQSDFDGMLLLLCSEASNAITGAVLSVDDGQSLLGL